MFPPAELTLKISSAISTTVLLSVVVVPLTVKLPVIVASPAMLIALEVMSSDVSVPVTVGLTNVTASGRLNVTASPLTTAVISLAVPLIVNVSPPSIVDEVVPSLSVQEVLIAAVPAAVSLPCASTVKVGIAVVLP